MVLKVTTPLSLFRDARGAGVVARESSDGSEIIGTVGAVRANCPDLVAVRPLPEGS